MKRPQRNPIRARRRNRRADAATPDVLAAANEAMSAAAGAVDSAADSPAGEATMRLVLESDAPPATTTSETAEGDNSSAAGGQTFGFDPLYPADGFGSDAELVARARSDSDAFGLLYERYVDRIYSYCFHRVGNAQDAEDLTARTFYRALHALENYEERGLPFAAWLFRIAHNLVANWHRDRSRRRFLSLDRIWSQRSEQDDPEGELERKESHDALWEAINRLPRERRDLLLYKFSGRMSNVEIGGLLKKSESAVKSLYFRTLAALRKDLEAGGWGSEEGDAVHEVDAFAAELQMAGVLAADAASTLAASAAEDAADTAAVIGALLDEHEIQSFVDIHPSIAPAPTRAPFSR